MDKSGVKKSYVLETALMAGPMVLIFFWPSFSDPFNLPKLLALSVLSLAVVSTSFFERQSSAIKQLSPMQRTYIGLLFVFLLSLVSSAILSHTHLARSLFGLPGRNNALIYYSCSVILAYFVSTRSRQSAQLTSFSRYLVVASAMLALYSLIQYFNLDPVPWQNPYNPIIGTLGNPNFSAAALSSLAIFLLALTRLTSSRAINKVKSAMLTVLATILVFLSWKTGSLQGPLIFFAGIAIYVLWLVLNRFPSKFLRYVILIIAFSLVFLASLTLAGLGPLGDRFGQYTLRLRAIYASIGFKAMVETPFTGYGPDSYMFAFRKFRETAFVKEFGSTLLSDNAHSTPVQIGATFGAIAFVSYVLLQLIVLSSAIRTISKGPTQGIRWALSYLWVLLFAQSLLSIEQIGLGILNWIVGAVIVGGNYLDEAKSVPINLHKKNPAKNITYAKEARIFALAIASLIFVPLSREDTAWKNMVGINVKGAVEREFLVGEFSKLTFITLDEPSKAGRLLENLYAANELDIANSVIDNLYKKNPQDMYANELKGIQYSLADNEEEELSVYKTMTLLDPQNAKVWLQRGKLELQLDQVVLAEKSFKRVVFLSGIQPEGIEAKSLLNSLNSKRGN